MLGLESGVVRLAAHDMTWAQFFALEKQRLQDAIGAYVLDIQHVGSTAIPGIPAKPILDIGVAVRNFEAAAVCIAPLEALGYTYLGENGIPRRHFFHRGQPRTHHLHINEIGSQDWENQVLFRDYLLQHPLEAQRYAALKRELAARFPNDREAYLEGKAPFIAAALHAGRVWQARLPLDAARLTYAAQVLASRDPDLARLVTTGGAPPLWQRPQGFATLLYIILEQQVSLASARAAYQRLLALTDPLTAASFLALDDDTLRRVGFSRQKMTYGRLLARAILAGEIDLAALTHLDDAHARRLLLKLKGVGPWTADIYLLEVLLRPDIWPVGDLALAAAVQRVKRLPERPAPADLERLAEPWRPWRGVAARLFWHAYLNSYHG